MGSAGLTARARTKRATETAQEAARRALAAAEYRAPPVARRRREPEAQLEARSRLPASSLPQGRAVAPGRAAQEPPPRVPWPAAACRAACVARSCRDARPADGPQAA